MNGSQPGPVEHEDRWILGLRGQRVTRIAVDYQLTLTLDAEWAIVLETPLRLWPKGTHPGPGELITPETQDVAAALPLFGTQILSAVAFKSGSLRIMFSSAVLLRCPPDVAYEAWQITGPDGWRFSCVPPGELAVWSAP